MPVDDSIPEGIGITIDFICLAGATMATWAVIEDDRVLEWQEWIRESILTDPYLDADAKRLFESVANAPVETIGSATYVFTDIIAQLGRRLNERARGKGFRFPS